MKCPKLTKKKLHKAIYCLYDGILNLVFPPCCPICDAITGPGMKICPTCRTKIQIALEPVCKKCGKPVGEERAEYCYDCKRKKHFYDQGKAFCIHKGEIRESLYRMKYANRRGYAKVYAGEWYQLHRKWLDKRQIDLIIPIPLHKKRKRRRGYNQSMILAAEIKRVTGIPVSDTILYRSKETLPQKDLDDASRKANIKNAFKIVTHHVQLRNILLVDDIYTTGSTIDSAAEVLKKAGADKVYFAVISIGRGY